jgi:hypothetical protein
MTIMVEENFNFQELMYPRERFFIQAAREVPMRMTIDLRSILALSLVPCPPWGTGLPGHLGSALLPEFWRRRLSRCLLQPLFPQLRACDLYTGRRTRPTWPTILGHRHRQANAPGLSRAGDALARGPQRPLHGNPPSA